MKESHVGQKFPSLVLHETVAKIVDKSIRLNSLSYFTKNNQIILLASLFHCVCAFRKPLQH